MTREAGDHMRDSTAHVRVIIQSMWMCPNVIIDRVRVLTKDLTSNGWAWVGM